MPSRQLLRPAETPVPPEGAPEVAGIKAIHGGHRVVIHIMMALGAGILIAAALTALAVLLYRRLNRARTAPAAGDGKLSPASSPALHRFSYGELRRATASFSPAQRLGQGGFGSVYRGVLPSGQEVAVKLMDSGSLQGEREFQNELSLAEKISSQASPESRWVVAPMGFCYADGRRRIWWRRRWREEAEEEDEGDKGRRILLVYELMQNGSLQDAMLDRRCPELLDWSRRFSVAIDIARGLQFLHSVCDPPVIHGDIKPSNILLDSLLSARIADFGLARLKTAIPDDAAAQLDEEEAVDEVDLDKVAGSECSPKSGKRDANGGVGGREDEASVMGETVESTVTTGLDENPIGNGIDRSPEEDERSAPAPDAEGTASPVEMPTAVEAASTSEAGNFDRMSLGSGSEGVGRKRSTNGGGSSLLSGKDWWWRQDTGGGANPESGGSVKDYVMEWIKSEIKKERPKSDWVGTAPSVSAEDCLPKTSGRSDKRKQQRRMEWWASLDEEKLKKKVKSKPAREWWREEFCEELTNKQKRRTMANSNNNGEGGERPWWQKDDDVLFPSERRKKRKNKQSWSRSSRASLDWLMDGLSGDLKATGRRSSRDWMSGEIPKSGNISSTPSMRGTVCYVAPEYGGGGLLSEKCDIYSFGVLLLVIVSGRRPLQVTASPMSEFERANLISWARNLGHMGRLLDLVDPLLLAVNREQALLCITVALLCIQRSPAPRPSSKEIVGMLTGQSEAPNLPLEFSPSPPGGCSFKARKKAR